MFFYKNGVKMALDIMKNGVKNNCKKRLYEACVASIIFMIIKNTYYKINIEKKEGRRFCFPTHFFCFIK